MTVAGSSVTEFDKSNGLIIEFSVKVDGNPEIEAFHVTLLPPPLAVMVGKVTIRLADF